MRKAAKKKKKDVKRAPRRPASYYQAILWQDPKIANLKNIKWIKLFLVPPKFKVITIRDGKVDDLAARLSRGKTQTAPDWVCWVNQDSQDRAVQFINGRWPFDPSLNPGDETIEVPAKRPSAWYQLSPSSGAQGFDVLYEYGVDVAPGPPGPGIISED